MKDLFSKQASLYRQYRPEYPQELYTHILAQVKGREFAWDCGTGNGQVAAELAQHFQEVEATDISESQLKNAIEKPNVYYKLCQAERTHFDEKAFDLITVAQAIHWFDFEAFYAEVRRVAKPEGILAVWGYGLFRVDEKVDALLDDFYSNIIGPYWDPERRYIDDKYSSIPFPFKEIESNSSFAIRKQWGLAALEGFLNSWSAVQKYIQDQGQNPVNQFMSQVRQVWPEGEQKEVCFPLFLRMGQM